MATPNLRLFTFHGAWGLPTTGPFGLKLEACLRMLDVPYERVLENDPRKGPKGKSPWIEDGDVKIGDSELVLRYLHERYGKALDGDLTAAERARSHVIRRALEEHFHQVYEYELCVLDAGWERLYAHMSPTFPAPLRPLIGWVLRRQFTNQLRARGIARHTPAEVAAMGKADVDAVAELLRGREWLVADRPTKVDASAFGLLGLAVLSDLPTPVCSHARTVEPVVRYVERCKATFFPELAEQPPLRAVAG